jgi:hypothetical protein
MTESERYIAVVAEFVLLLWPQISLPLLFV